MSQFKRESSFLKKILKSYQSSRWRNIWISFLCAILLVFGIAWAIVGWYHVSERDKPDITGVSFVPNYAEYLGVNPEQTFDALTNIGVRHFRLVSYWSDIEKSPNQYDFSQLDWQFKKVNQVGGTISLAIGLRQPRWPECHAPDWINTDSPKDNWQPRLEKFMTKVIKRYKNNPALKSYQLENEYFNNFGECPDHSRSRLVGEYKLVKKLDPSHPVIISRSNNYPNLPLGQPRPDKFGISVYRRVWSDNIHRYFNYPMNPSYYSFLAGFAKLTTHEDSILHEMQAEPWPPEGKSIPNTSLAEQNKTFNAQIFKKRISFAQKTGIKSTYYWGGEYWYYRWKIEGDKSVWTVAQHEFSNYN